MKHKCHHPNLQTCLIWQVWNRSKCSQLFPFSLLSGVLAFSVLPCLEQCLSWSGWCPVNWSVSEGWERWSGHGKSLDWVNKLNSLWGKENQKSGSFRNTEASASSCEQLASLFPPCVQAKRWETTVQWGSGRHSDTGSKSVLGPADLSSVSYAGACSELRHGFRLLRTGFLPRTQLISQGPFKANFTCLCTEDLSQSVVSDSRMFPF